MSDNGLSGSKISESQSKEAEAKELTKDHDNEPSVSKVIEEVEQNEEPPKKRARAEIPSYYNSSDDGSSFLNEFDSDDFTFSPPEDSAEYKLFNSEKEVRELRKKLAKAEERLKACRCDAVNNNVAPHVRLVRLPTSGNVLDRLRAGELHSNHPFIEGMQRLHQGYQGFGFASVVGTVARAHASGSPPILQRPSTSIPEDEPFDFANNPYLEPPDLGTDPNEDNSIDDDDDHDGMYENELEVASVSDNTDNPIENNDSSSASDGPPLLVNHPPNQHRSDIVDPDTAVIDEIDCTADGESTSEDNMDIQKLGVATKISGCSQLSFTDKWHCIQCNSKSLPNFRYCQRCYRIRRNWLPKRPQSRRLKKRKTAQFLGTHPEIEIPKEDQVNGPASSASRPAPSTTYVDLNQAFMVDDDSYGLSRLNPTSLDENVTLELLTPPPSNHSSQESAVKIPEIPINLDSSSVNEYSVSAIMSKCLKGDSSSKMCSLCCTREKNAAFVHNKIAHHFTCYPCADKILKRNGKCPICRERVLRVVKIISV